MDPRTPQLLVEIRAEFPRFRIVHKDRDLFSRIIHAALVVVTLGGQRRYLTSYQTTIGDTLYVTPDWDTLPDAQRYVTLRHERVHLRQFRRYTLPGMALLYLLVPLPLGLAWFRARFEMEAYAESVRATAEVHGPRAARAPALRDHVVAQFVSGAYGWMWPFRRTVERWYDAVVTRLAEPQQ